MPDLPTKDEIVERAGVSVSLCATRDAVHVARAALDALTIAELMLLLRERGCRVIATRAPNNQPTRQWIIEHPESAGKPDAVS